MALSAICLRSSGQVNEQSGWLASFNSLKISKNLGMHFDLQFRSADELSYLRHLLVRPGLTYFIDGKQNVTAGYAWIENFANPDIAGASNLTEHRIWEQYLLSYKIQNLPFTHRFRLEQRFVERPGGNVFAQRLRYFVRTLVPLRKDSVFQKGAFLALQNEVFLNLQNKEKFNNKVFDQNRAYAALGYRLNKSTDFELGYLHQYIDGAAVNTANHVLQLAVYKRLQLSK